MVEAGDDALTTEAVEEFASHFDKVALENRLLELESAMAANADTRVDLVQELFREIHSMKGTAGMLKFQAMNQFLHGFEDALGILSKQIHQISGVRNRETFNYYLSALDIVEQLIDTHLEDPQTDIRVEPVLLNSLFENALRGKEMVANAGDYFEFTELDEDLF